MFYPDFFAINLLDLRKLLFLVNDKSILYLASASKDDSFFWKLGVTNSEKKIKMNQGSFLEFFRKEFLGNKESREIYNAISLNIHNLLSSVESEGYILEKPLNGFSYDIPLNVIAEIFDFWLELYNSPQRWQKAIGLLNCRKHTSYFLNRILDQALIGDSSELILRIEYLHSYRPLKLNKKIEMSPMW